MLKRCYCRCWILLFGLRAHQGAWGQTSVKPELGAWGFDLTSIDRRVLPGDDFFRFAEGNWLKNTSLPAGRSVWGMFDLVERRTAQRLAALIQEDRRTIDGRQPDASLEQVRALYAGFMNVAAMNQRGLVPIQQEKDLLTSLRSLEDVARLMGQSSQGSLVSITLCPDPQDRSRLRVALAQGGLGLPGRDYYLKETAPFVGYRSAYQNYVAETLRAAGLPDAEERALAIVALESKLARIAWTPAQTRDSKINADAISPVELGRYAPGFNWAAFLAARKVEGEQTLILQTDTALKGEAQIFSQTKVESWSDYLLFHWIVNHAAVLPSGFADARFAFYFGTLKGVKTQRTRDDLAIEYVNARIGDLVGRLYVQRYFSAAARDTMQEMVDALRAAFADRLAQATWLDQPTRKQALAKLDALTVRIGYPSHWRDYAAVVVKADDAVGNQDRLAQSDWDDLRAKLHQPMSSREWYQNPQMIDATSSKVYNSIEFPAGILQSPFFDPLADPAVNFGAIGAIVGHEMGHNFDDQGSQFDQVGRRRDWWSAGTRKAFVERTSRLIQQYDAYSPVEGMHVNGSQTLGENIGDLTGVVVAYQAYQKFLEKRSQGRAPILDGWSGDQRFFLAWAQVWRCVYIPDATRGELLQGYHSPAQFRVNGVVRNVAAWYHAFGVQPGQALYLPPQERVDLW